MFGRIEQRSFGELNHDSIMPAGGAPPHISIGCARLQRRRGYPHLCIHTWIMYCWFVHVLSSSTPHPPIPIAARYVWVYRAAILRTLLTTQTPLAGRHFWVSRAAIIQGIKSRLDHAMIWRAQYIRGARSESQRGGAAPLTVQSGRRACNERAPPSGHGAVHSAEIP